jgi:hypothetical protein
MMVVGEKTRYKEGEGERFRERGRGGEGQRAGKKESGRNHLARFFPLASLERTRPKISP